MKSKMERIHQKKFKENLKEMKAKLAEISLDQANVSEYYKQESHIRGLFATLNQELAKLNLIGSIAGKDPIDIVDLVKHNLISQEELDNYHAKAKPQGVVNPTLTGVKFKPYNEIKTNEKTPESEKQPQ